jgi:hypothetical protein
MDHVFRFLKRKYKLSDIPLLDIPKQILERYKDSEFARTDGRVFKLQHHVCVNWQLKRLAKAASIDKRLTFHMSRFTFATTVCLTQGVPIESISQMMRHLSIKTTQIYAEVTRTKIDEDMTNRANMICRMLRQRNELGRWYSTTDRIKQVAGYLVLPLIEIFQIRITTIVQAKDLKGVSPIETEHVDNNTAVRKMLLERRIVPERLPPVEVSRKWNAS